MKLYPLKFTPLSKYRIWGGNKLNSILNKDFSDVNIGESWEISGVEGDETKVKDGPLKGKTLKEIASEYKNDFLGNNVYNKFKTNFPLLIKFIDAKTPLSVQVHPHDPIAMKRHNSFGKNEMWYIMNADDNAEIIVGFNKPLDKKTYSEYLENGKVLEVLNKVKTQPGDAFNIPTGRVHAIGAGVLLAEIQQTSDITYRIYDYNRIDKTTGKQRDLHNDLALDVIDFEIQENYKTTYELRDNISNKLIYTPYFKSNIISLTTSTKKNYSNIDSFVIYICTNGCFEISTQNNNYMVYKGETILIPACINELDLIPHNNSEILEIYY